jgi:hypothetical protein
LALGTAEFVFQAHILAKISAWGRWVCFSEGVFGKNACQNRAIVFSGGIFGTPIATSRSQSYNFCNHDVTCD